MSEFVIRFFICNLYLTGFICILLVIKHLFRHHISARIQFNLWFFMLALQLIPFLPFHLPRLWDVLQLAGSLNTISETGIRAIGRFDPSMAQSSATGWADSFAVSVSHGAPSALSFLLCSIWVTGVFGMLLLILRSRWRIKQLKASALLLQNRQVFSLFRKCTALLHMTSNISIYSTAFLKSPVTVGLLHPRIYLPIHLISDYDEKDMKYILLHELEHCRYKDAIPNFLMTLAGMLYWFNPVVWYALREMRTDREVACDSAVLQNLAEKDYEDYGTTLINFAERISLSPFPFVSGLGGNIGQMKKRIINIASYQPSSSRQKMRGFCIYVLIALMFLTSAPLLSTYAANQEYYNFQSVEKNVSYLDLSSYFGEYNGSFVLYDTAGDRWEIYNKDAATLRVSPDSTYKIYEGLVGLETGTISPDASRMTWDGTNQPFAAWNTDQDLNSAMHHSVNWYFDALEKSIGLPTMQSYLNQINYGNRDLSAKTSCWMESSLKISPIEQVELLKDLNTNQFSVKQSNIDAIKNSICISSDSEKTIYGKTGTGRINGHDINGWFIGYIEAHNHTTYFALNIQGDDNATGEKATELTRSILSAEFFP
ncbi:MAG: BlaR1 family beta-lactam sensor/signal transducer [Hespellia sp.]|nr:BlaR1 family beta-lactam sensor/signal transducer [Hespellia sp.]